MSSRSTNTRQTQMFKVDPHFHCKEVVELDPDAPRKFCLLAYLFCVVHSLPCHALEVQLFQCGFSSHEEKPLCTAHLVPYLELMSSVISRFLGHDFIKHSTLFPSGSSHRTHSSLAHAKHCCTHANQNLSNYVSAEINLSTNS